MDNDLQSLEVRCNMTPPCAYKVNLLGSRTITRTHALSGSMTLPLAPKIHRPLGYLKSQDRKALSEKHRGSRHERGYTSRWDKARKGWLAKHPLCAEHDRKGEVVVGTVVDHVVPHRGDKTLFWSRDNWQTLCAPCHSSKTAREDGGFGNRKRGPLCV
jgi:5-methylcytosine-specific restriction protein A